MNIFKKLIDNTIPSHKIWEDEKFLAILDLQPINPGHVLLLQKLEKDYLFDLNDCVH